MVFTAAIVEASFFYRIVSFMAGGGGSFRKFEIK